MHNCKALHCPASDSFIAAPLGLVLSPDLYPAVTSGFLNTSQYAHRAIQLGKACALHPAQSVSNILFGKSNDFNKFTKLFFIFLF